MNAAAVGWRGGAAISTFPIAAGTPLTGYVAREGPATGTLDALTVGALVLERGDQRLVIVATDLAAVDADLVQEIAAAAGVARSQVALCPSHTHSGPAGVVARLHPASPDELNPALRERFVTSAAETIAAAQRDLQPVDLVFGTTTVQGVAANRNDPAITAATPLSVLATRRGDGSIHGAVVHFACHPTILSAASRVVSADFPGALRRCLAELLPQSETAPIVLYVNGAAGDISTRFTRRAQDAAEVDHLGGLLAATANGALQDARLLSGPIRHGSVIVPLAPRTHPVSNGQDAIAPEAVGDERVADSLGQQRIAETREQGIAMLAALAALPAGVVATNCELDAWLLGDLALVTMPGELFASFGRQISAAASESTLVLGYANGYIGYLADLQAFAAETYEALASPYGPEDSERVATAAVTLVARLRSKPAFEAANSLV